VHQRESAQGASAPLPRGTTSVLFSVELVSARPPRSPFSACSRSGTSGDRLHVFLTCWICRPVASVEVCAMLRSANYGELVEPRTRGKRYGPRSFRIAAPCVWNSLPRHLRNDDISHEQFARDLKTFLFVRGAFENVCLKVLKDAL